MPLRHIPNGTFPGGAGPSGEPASVSPEVAGWAYSGIRVIRLGPGETRTWSTGDEECFILPLSAEGVEVVAGSDSFQLEGRSSVFARVSDFVYIGRDTEVTLTAPTGGEIAIPTSRCEQRLPPRYGPAEDVPVEIRGAGPATRQVEGALEQRQLRNLDRDLRRAVEHADRDTVAPTRR